MQTQRSEPAVMWQSQAWQVLPLSRAFSLNSPALSLSAKITRRLTGVCVSPQQKALGDTELPWHSGLKQSRKDLKKRELSNLVLERRWTLAWNRRWTQIQKTCFSATSGSLRPTSPQASQTLQRPGGGPFALLSEGAAGILQGHSPLFL